MKIRRWLGVGVLGAVLLAVSATADPAGAQQAEPYRVTLYATCNNVAMTHPAGTSMNTVADGITGDLESIFRYNNATGDWSAWAPGVPDYAVDYPAVERLLEPVFICMRSMGEIVQPNA